MTDITAKPLWRQRNLRIAWSAVFVNDTGDWVLIVALPVFVFIETRSGSATAILFMLQAGIAALLGPVGGSLVDRWNLRRVLVWTNLAQAAALLPLIAVNSERVWPAYIVMGLQSALSQLNNPANIALLPRLVESEELSSANAALSAAASLARLGGAALGGLLVSWRGLPPVIVFDGLSFLLVAAAVPFIRADTSAAQSSTQSVGRIRAGLRSVASNPPLGTILSIQGLAQIAQGGFVVLFVVFLVESLGDDGSAVGLIRGTMAIGSLVGSVIVARMAKKFSAESLFSVGLMGMGVVSLLFWNAPLVTTTIWVYIVLFALSGLPGSALTVGLFTTIQTRSPREVLGRVVGFLSTSEAIGVATGSIIAGLLVDYLPLEPILNTQATIYIIAGIAALILTNRSRATSKPRHT